MRQNEPSVTVGGLTLPKQFLLDLTGLGLPLLPEKDRTCAPVSEPSGEWEVVHYAYNPATSYCGALLKTTIDDKPAYVIWHYGTTDLRDVPHGLTVTLGLLPEQLRDALHFTRQCREEIEAHSPDAHVLQAGHSLGGALAILANKEKLPCITFDSPGTSQFLERLNRDPDTCREHTLEILSPHENLVNTQGTHVGNILIAGEPHWEAPEHRNVTSFVKMTLDTHRIHHIHAALQKTEDFTLQRPEDLERSPTFFHAYMNFKYGNRKEDEALDVSQLSRADRLLLHTLDIGLKNGFAIFFEKSTKSLAKSVMATVTSVSGAAMPKGHKQLIVVSPDDPIPEKTSWKTRLTRKPKDAAQEVTSPTV